MTNVPSPATNAALRTFEIINVGPGDPEGGAWRALVNAIRHAPPSGSGLNHGRWMVFAKALAQHGADFADGHPAFDARDQAWHEVVRAARRGCQLRLQLAGLLGIAVGAPGHQPLPLALLDRCVEAEFGDSALSRGGVA